jgi:hypothetical protein
MSKIEITALLRLARSGLDCGRGTLILIVGGPISYYRRA